MSILEIQQEINRLKNPQDLLALQEAVHLALRRALLEPRLVATQIDLDKPTPITDSLIGILKWPGTPPTDDELKAEYHAYLEAKYQ